MKDACVPLMTVRALNAVATSWDPTLAAPSLLVFVRPNSQSNTSFKTFEPVSSFNTEKVFAH